MDLTITHLWAAGYDLPPETAILKPRDAGKTTTSVVVAQRRGKKAARAKRARAK